MDWSNINLPPKFLAYKWRMWKYDKLEIECVFGGWGWGHDIRKASILSSVFLGGARKKFRTQALTDLEKVIE